MRCILLIVLMIMPIGCGSTQSPAAEEVSFRTDATQYAPGDDVQLRLTNRTDQVVGYNLCLSELVRDIDGEWELVRDPATVCTMIQHGLEPGGSASYAKTLMSDPPEGTYRYRANVEFRDDQRQEMVVTGAFTVGR